MIGIMINERVEEREKRGRRDDDALREPDTCNIYTKKLPVGIDRLPRRFRKALLGKGPLSSDSTKTKFHGWRERYTGFFFLGTPKS